MAGMPMEHVNRETEKKREEKEGEDKKMESIGGMML